jgi:signal transduction histidine kinase
MQQIELEKDYREAYYRTKCFKGIFTHDISNLFQIISNSVELCGSLLKEELNVRDLAEYFELIAQQLNRGKTLITNMRNLSMLEENEMPLEPIDAFQTIRNAIQFAQLGFPKKELEIKVFPEEGEFYVMANELLLDVFENLIMNSIIYNKNEKVQITIEVSSTVENNNQYIRFQFKDNGIGIDENHKANIFSENRYQSKLSKGMGIGLSLVAKLIELCGGKVFLKDRIKGDHSQGSNFILLIPQFKIIWSEE